MDSLAVLLKLIGLWAVLSILVMYFFWRNEMTRSQATPASSQIITLERMLQERDAEIERLTAMPLASEAVRVVVYGKKIDAQHGALKLGLEALEMGTSTFHTYPDKSDCMCGQCQFVRLRKIAITAIQEALS